MYKIDQSFGSIGKAPVPRTNGSNLFYCFPSWQTFNLGVTNTLLGEKKELKISENKFRMRTLACQNHSLT